MEGHLADPKDELPDPVHLRRCLCERIPAAVQVHAKQGAACVAHEDAIRVGHGHHGHVHRGP